MQTTERNRQREWSGAEKALLRSLWLDGVKMMEICRLLGRGEGGVDHQRRQLRLPSRAVPRVRRQRVKSKAERLDAGPFLPGRDEDYVAAILAEQSFPALDLQPTYRMRAA